MPATGAVTGASTVDFDAIPTYMKTLSGTATGGALAPKTHCVKRVRRWGLEASFCECLVQLKDIDTVVPGVSGVTDSPVYQLKQNDFAQVFTTSTDSNDPFATSMLFSGIITEITPDIGLDKAIVRIDDLRYSLDGVQLVGSWWGQVGPGGGIDYRQGVRAHFNKGNAPNCIFVDAGGTGEQTPVFCPPWYGIGRGTGSDPKTGKTNYSAIVVPNPSTEPTDTACYWTPANKLRYTQWATSKAAGAIVAALKDGSTALFSFYANSCVIPDSIIWNNKLAQALSDFQTVDRKASERVYHCTSVSKVINDICEEAGPYALFMQPNDDGKNTMQIVRTRYIASDASQTLPSGAGPTADAFKGTTVKRALAGDAGDGGNASANMTGPTVVAGNLRESSKNFYSKVIPVGDHVMIEARCCSAITDDKNKPAPNYGPYVPLIWNWSKNDLETAKAQFLAYLKTGATDVKATLKSMLRQSDVFAGWNVKPGFNFQAGTTQGGFPVATTNRDVLPHCLSSYFPSNAGDEFSRLNTRYPIPLENSAVAYDAITEAAAFAPVMDANGLAVKGRGVISLRMLRDQDLENKIVQDGSGGGDTPDAFLFNIKWHRDNPSVASTTVIDKFEPKRIRLTVGIPCDHRLTNPLQIPSAGNDIPDIENMESDDSDRINNTVAQRAIAIDTGGLTAWEERGGTYGGYPVPQSLKVPPGFTDPYPMAGSVGASAELIYGPDAVIRDDSQYQKQHATNKLQEFGRLDRGGILESDRLELSAQVGELIDVIDNTSGGTFPVKAVVKQIEDNFITGKTTRTLV